VAVILAMCSKTVYLSAASFDALYILPMFLLIVGLAAAPGTLPGRLLSTRPAILLGEASFALYLIHYTLLHTLNPQWQNSLSHWLVAQAGTFAVILCAAMGAHLMIEKPAQRWIRKVFTPRRPAPLPTADRPNISIGRQSPEMSGQSLLQERISP